MYLQRGERRLLLFWCPNCFEELSLIKRLTQDEVEGGELPGVIHDIAEYRVEPEAGIDSDPVPLRSKKRKCFITGSKYYRTCTLAQSIVHTCSSSRERA